MIYCGAHPSGDGRCGDVVLDLDPALNRAGEWRIVGVSHDGFADDQSHQFRLSRDVPLSEQLDGLAETLPADIEETPRQG